MTIQITKVGHKDDKTLVHSQEDKNGDTVKSELNSDAKPTPEFHEAMKKLGAYMCDHMGFPADWKRDHKCLYVHIGHESEKEKRINAIVTINVKLEKFNNGITINSPVLREKLQGIPGGGSFMTPTMLELVKNVMVEGEKYMNGERAQHELLPKAERGSKRGKKHTFEETAQGQADAFAQNAT